MGFSKHRVRTGARGFLGRLAGDVRANTLAIMAAILIPMVGLAGSAVDVSRLYLVKVRLQQACDAGALAGRKSMTDTSATTLDETATAQAQAFFTNNFKPGWMSTQNVVFTPTKTSDSRVAGTATAVVPMTLMKMFGMPNQTITVNCEARYDVADTDIIFVLDTTGSMACLPSDSSSDCSDYVGTVNSNKSWVSYSRPSDSSPGASSGSVNDSVSGYPNTTAYYVPEKSGSRIAALRSAVIAFYSTMAANIQPGTHIRYGFVTYTSAVNAGKAIMGVGSQYMIGGSGSGSTNFTYQSRKVTADYQISSTLKNTYNNVSQSTCNGYKVARSPSTPLTYDSSQQATETTVTFSGTPSTNGTCNTYSVVYGPKWIYQPVSYDVTQYLTRASITDPSRLDGATASWSGCVEQPSDGSAGSSSFSTANLPASLNPDIASTATALWAPMFPEVIYTTGTANATKNGELATNSSDPKSYWNYTGSGSTNVAKYQLKYGYYVCGKPVRRLTTMSLTDVTNYVNATDFRAVGGTYHDTGMIWGVRMLSPNGIFSADTAAWPNRPAPNRVIVFLTDGDMAPDETIYSMYGVEKYDDRVTGSSSTALKDLHNARFLAECDKAKALNINIWTVSIAPSATTEMTSCATNSTQALYTTNGTDLSTKFQAIAMQVARLRLSQ